MKFKPYIVTRFSAWRHVWEHINDTGYQQTRDGKIIYKFSTDPVALTVNPKGLDVTLTIDAAIQHVCEKELFKMIKEILSNSFVKSTLFYLS